MTDTPSPFHALIVAAGNGARMGGGLPKQYRLLGGKPVLRHAIDAFLATPGLQSLTVVISPGHEQHYRDATDGLTLPPPIEGAGERQGSVANGLRQLTSLGQNEVILVHDAARPFIDPKSIVATVRAAHRGNAAALAIRATDTLRRDDGQSVDRTGLWCMQTPQAFKLGVLSEAHRLYAGSATDDASMVEAMGHKVEIVSGTKQNFKITTEDDWLMAEKLAAKRYETRSGIGFDVHAFAQDGKGHISVCGVAIPHPYDLEGHSDADLGLHVLTDALLGAMALGDIGQHFPSSDPQWRGASSDIFLRHAVRLVEDRGARITSLDLILIGEEPRMGPHRQLMREKIAQICGIDPNRVSVKATTTQTLGFTGRREGLAAQAVATVEVPYND